MEGRRLIIVTGPTAVGKTAYAVDLAQRLGTEIIGCDSRQFYREMRIGVARPSEAELAAVRHHFVACRAVTDPFNIYDYEQEAISLIERLFEQHEVVVACGGSGLYIDALCQGVSPMPSPTAELRSHLQQLSLEEKRAQLRLLDPDYYSRVDLRNPVRLQRALEVCLTAGRPYSQVVAERKPAQRSFQIEVRVLRMEPEELRRRIDRRVDQMMEEGLMDEVHSLLPYRHLNTLNTVGYRELFACVDGQCTLDEAVSSIKLNTWHYARKQITWMRRYDKSDV